jgi:polyhydroxyalkanoate synthase
MQTSTDGTRKPHMVSPGTIALERDSYGATALADTFDRSIHAGIARLTAGLDPAAIAAAYADWVSHLAASPGQQLRLVEKFASKLLRFYDYLVRSAYGTRRAAACIEPLPQDHRFRAAAWQRWPYNLIHQSFLLQQQWWHNAMTGNRGVTRHHEQVVSFATRQWLDMFCPANFAPTNPEVVDRTFGEAGFNLVRGMGHLIDDALDAVGHVPSASALEVGRDIAATRGKVIYRNRLMELIRYSPVTDVARPEPVLVVPAWIMKYYILDLSPRNSLVRYLVGRGYTVFMISWKNPGPEDRDLSLDDYRVLGIRAALDVIGELIPAARVHAAGYCLGGTLLAIAAAAMARDGDDRLASATFLAAQTDFTDAGELTLFIDESQVAFLEDLMWEQGFLDAGKMAGAFQLLRSNDLVWSRLVREYLLGERETPDDLMTWNADATRMPYRMHADYLRKLFLDNDLAEGRYEVDGKPISLGDVRLPLFVVGTERDHVAPWPSVYKLHIQTDSDLTFVLASGGHNVGIVAPPDDQPGQHYRAGCRLPGGRYLDAETWRRSSPVVSGSWWPRWIEWLDAHSGEPRSFSDNTSTALCDAPGEYVLTR